MGAEETPERYELWSASAQEDSTESVDSTDKETVKDNGLEEATESGSTDSSGGEGRAHSASITMPPKRAFFASQVIPST